MERIDSAFREIYSDYLMRAWENITTTAHIDVLAALFSGAAILMFVAWFADKKAREKDAEYEASLKLLNDKHSKALEKALQELRKVVKYNTFLLAQKRRGVCQMARTRDIKVRSVIADIICSGLEDAEFNKLLTRDDVEKWYLRLGQQFDLPDLFHKNKPRHPEFVKESIRKRMMKEFGWKREELDTFKPLKVIEPKTVEPEPQVPKRSGFKLLRLFSKKPTAAKAA